MSAQQGRIFSAFEARSFGGGRKLAGKHHRHQAPRDESEVAGAGPEIMHWGFQNGGLVSVRIFPQGARDVTVSFDPSFTTCSVGVLYGKPAGQATIRVRNRHTAFEHDLLDTSTASTSCAIRDGDIFGEESHS
jgi:hypothetical protein